MSSWLLPEGYLSHQRKVQLQCAHATAPSLLFTRLFWRMLSTLQRLLGSASDTGWMARRSWRYDNIFENQWVSSDGSEYPLDWICLKHSLESIYHREHILIWIQDPFILFVSTMEWSFSFYRSYWTRRKGTTLNTSLKPLLESTASSPGRMWCSSIRRPKMHEYYV